MSEVILDIPLSERSAGWPVGDASGTSELRVVSTADVEYRLGTELPSLVDKAEARMGMQTAITSSKGGFEPPMGSHLAQISAETLTLMRLCTSNTSTSLTNWRRFSSHMGRARR